MYIIYYFKATSQLKKIHKIWKNKRYKISQDLKRKKQLELKMLAEYLFKGNENRVHFISKLQRKVLNNFRQKM